MQRETFQELNKILADVTNETGTKVSLAASGGEETPFSFMFRGQEFTAYLQGAGEEAKARVRLVRYILSGTPANKGAMGKEEALKSILLGEGGAWDAFRFTAKYGVKDTLCFASDVVPDKHADECFRFLLRCLEGTFDLAIKMDDTRFCVVHFLENGQSPAEFGQFLFQSLYEELGVKASVGLGCEGKFSEIASSYSQAVTAVNLSGIFHSKGEVHSYREYLLVTMLKDIDEGKLKEYLKQFRIGNAAEIFSDPDMANTAEEFLENNLNGSEAARALFLHRNTLAYRLDKIQKVTGLNIRNFSDAVTFRVVSILYKMLKL